MLERRRVLVLTLVALAMAGTAAGLLALSAPGPAESGQLRALPTPPLAPADGGFSGEVPIDAGIVLLVTSETSSPRALVDALSAAFCPTVTLALLTDGQWSIYVVGAPAAVNAAFPATLAASTPFLVRCGESLRTFRYTSKVELFGTSPTLLIEQTGEVIFPDREHFSRHMDLFGVVFDSEVIVIGDSVWQKGDVPVADFGLSPLSFFGGATGLTFAADEQELNETALKPFASAEVTINGVATTRYELDGTEFESLLSSFAPVGASAPPTVTLWIAKDLGVAVRMVVQSVADPEFGTLRLEINITDMNASDISIEAPQ